MDRPLFHETQRMIGMIPLSLLIVAFLVFIIYKMRSGNHLTKILSVILILIGSFITIIIANLKLETCYYSGKGEYQFVSFFRPQYEVISLDSATRIKIVKYMPEDYGGWGIKGNADVRVYNASGNRGIMFTFKSGKSLLLGTHLPDALYAALKGKYPF